LTIWLKNIGATATVLQSVTMFFCGVYFPLAVLPDALHPVAQYIPFYYSIEGLRRSLLPSSTASELSFFAAMVGLFSMAFIALGWFVIRTGMRKAKRDGSLSHY
jgi:ABC-type polysaccharide/polyol phosphate export permease